MAEETSGYTATIQSFKPDRNVESWTVRVTREWKGLSREQDLAVLDEEMAFEQKLLAKAHELADSKEESTR